MKQEIKLIFDQFIHNTYVTMPEVARMLLKHERKELCLDHLCKEIQGVERSRMSISFTPALYKKLIEDVARFFCQQALRHAEERSMSSLERHKRVADANKMDAMEQEQEALVKELQEKKIKVYT